MNITSERACYLLMCAALKNGTHTISFVRPQDAIVWRHACYKMRRALKATDNHAFNRLSFKIKSNELIVERKDEG